MAVAQAWTRRIAIAGLLTPLGGRARADDSLADDVAAMLMLGWAGSTIQSPSARALAGHIAAGRVGSVVFVKENVGGREDLADVVRLFTATRTPLLAIDHEGGAVQRLVERHGVTRLPPARIVAASMTPEQARALYAQAGAEIRGLGFSVNLAPVVDLHDPANPAVGHFDRAFDADPARVCRYARACVQGFAEARVQCALKHFPGYGHAHTDSHDTLPDGAAIWSEQDLAPFAQMIAENRAPIVMASHMRVASLEPRAIPVTLSEPVMTGVLRRRLGFAGVAMTDDLDMKAVSTLMPRRQAVIAAIQAGNDLLMIRNEDNFDPDLPGSVLGWVQQAIADGALSRDRIARSAARVRLHAIARGRTSD